MKRPLRLITDSNAIDSTQSERKRSPCLLAAINGWRYNVTLTIDVRCIRAANRTWTKFRPVSGSTREDEFFDCLPARSGHSHHFANRRDRPGDLNLRAAAAGKIFKNAGPDEKSAHVQPRAVSLSPLPPSPSPARLALSLPLPPSPLPPFLALSLPTDAL